MSGSSPGGGFDDPSSLADTIFAPATAIGKAAIAVLRLSGPGTARALIALIGDLPSPRTARRRRLTHPDNGEPLDDALVLWFPAPASFTGEDIAELHLHGSRAVLAAVIDALGGLGLRLAEPGEFTRRAFYNGKLDLTQAEAIADLTAAETEAQRRQALRQLDGELGGLYRDWSQRLTRTLAHVEAAIDFPDEDLPPAIEQRIVAETRSLRTEIAGHLADGHRGERLRDGITIAIVGPPNAGKSSLLNRIARREAAITSPIPGTTRDIVEVAIDLAGYPVILADTAGLRESNDPIEQEGLRRAHRRAAEAEIRLFVFDARTPADAAGAAAWPGPDTIVVANKIDLLGSADPRLSQRETVMPGLDPSTHGTRREAVSCRTDSDDRDKPDLDAEVARSKSHPEAWFPVSALTGAGLDALLQVLAARLAAAHRIEGPVLTRARHRHALEDAAASLDRALAADLSELRAEDLRLALRCLGQITGAVGVEDLLDIIFRDFCLGK
ncbi:MAG TPA: tRNA uridine-5-carboxymethylaminomethyl(34) synthesis GTPase MnmE [Stellaceae bacterium]|nr:tRNA uridine-5-carboxymethylaminomethyl(34) synthesis GTPase MnmE [Stellaceae bacterium]